MRTRASSLLLLAAVSACAGTVTNTITAGTAILTPGQESFTLSGPGFSFTGSGPVSEYPCGPVVACMAGAAIPSSPAALDSNDRGVSGTITLGARFYDYMETPLSMGDASLTFAFDLIAPVTTPPSSPVLTAPFTAVAEFDDVAFDPHNLYFFYGSGTVTVDLTSEGTPSGTRYYLQSMQFEFTSVPEPRPALLVFAVIVLSCLCRLAWSGAWLAGTGQRVSRA